MSFIETILQKNTLTPDDFAALLSGDAENYLEPMAIRAQEITLRNFGKTIQLYTPIYLANFCDNRCLYCGFNADNDIERKKLSLPELKQEAQVVASSGLKHVLLLTGESRKMSPVSYIAESIKLLREYFSSISIEVYPLSEAEYRMLVESGVDGLTIYQEAYDQDVYRQVHPSGPKSDYFFRLEAPERGAKAGMRNINIGALLGLADWRKEIFSCGRHAKYLQDKFPEVEIGVSLPRLRPHQGNFQPVYTVSDKNIAQIILALRIFLPRSGITISTRESAEFRANLIPLGITRLSAGSSTQVGGRIVQETRPDNSCQFEISDHSSVDEVKLMIQAKGYQPVVKDWMIF